MTTRRLGAAGPLVEDREAPVSRERTRPLDGAAEAAPRFLGIRRTLVEGLVLLCRIGIYPKERTTPQRVRVDVELVAREEPEGVPDRIDAVICYERLVRRIQEIAQAGHVNLVETLAARIADHCCANPGVERVRVTVRKIDVMPEAEAVGVEIERVAAGLPR